MKPKSRLQCMGFNQNDRDSDPQSFVSMKNECSEKDFKMIHLIVIGWRKAKKWDNGKIRSMKRQMISYRAK